ncbi:MAG: hypothetical protein HQ574_04855 [Chloroflexi bacterium]|nr:hypothetical protein [Chloroflexota bacterium]
MSRDEFPAGHDMDIREIVTRVEEPLFRDQVAFFTSLEKPFSESWAQGEIVLVGGMDVLVGAKIVADAADVGLAIKPTGVSVGGAEGVKSSVASGVSGFRVSVNAVSGLPEPGEGSSDVISVSAVGFGVTDATTE